MSMRHGLTRCRRRCPRLAMLPLLCLVLWLAFAPPSAAGVMTRALLEKQFPPPLMVGEKDKDIPVWPVFSRNAAATVLAGYLFESIDFAAVPGFSGVPVNLLVALDAKGKFLDVLVISHHEPVFLEGLGEAPLKRFVSQYQGLSLTQNFAVDPVQRGSGPRIDDAGNVQLDGVAKATASVRIINQSVLSAALKVARKKLGFAGGRDPERTASLRTDVNDLLTIPELRARGLLRSMRLGNAEVEKAFTGTPGEGLDQEALARPDDIFIDMRAALVSVPSIRNSLLDEASARKLEGRLEEGDHAVLVRWSGRYGPVSDSFMPGTVPDRLVLSQGGLPIEMRDLNLDLRLRQEHEQEQEQEQEQERKTPPAQMKVFRIISQAGLDPSQPLDLSLRVTRLKGMIYPERIGQDFRLSYRLPERYYLVPSAKDRNWLPIWKDHRTDLAVITAGMLLLFAALTAQKRLTINAERFTRFRIAFLGFTLFFIGWHAQGQLSIVNITSVIQALKDGRSLDFLLYNPVTVVVWCGTLISLLIWGRGTFCGWLCPFGALQELTGKLGQWLRLPQMRLRPAADARLKLLKYVVLAVILISIVVAPAFTDSLMELEPFKTAITLNFVRSWPFVLYAAGLLAASAFCYKFFCRYLCPFGAGLALMGRVRMFAWLPRRDACGKPCQTCRHRCDYEAIRPNGTIRYDECFQCMDCVVIYRSDDKCAPLMLEKKRRPVIPIAPVSSC
ncbi:4Fe-4S binding protein [Noviherbaspirillum aerium]|uniref:4Fe-4S binding protein n=1 Tax=Noviherbaspirillum aerium TaxID=2588497 RepID=UPI001CEF8BA0|nr:4Fe-4S binding protein [Noviherbaspirillum aerium]